MSGRRVAQGVPGGVLRRSLAGLIASTALVAAVAPAAARAAWDAPRPLDHPVAAAAGNAQGVEAFIWQVRAAGTVGSSGIHFSYAALAARLPDGGLTPPQVVSATSGDATRSLAIGVDRLGTITAAWVSLRRGAVMVAVGRAGGRFSAPVELPGHAFIGQPITLAVAADGAAAIVNHTGSQITVVQRPAGRCPSSSPSDCFGALRFLRSPATSEGFASPLSPAGATFGPHDRLYVTWPDHLAVLDGRQIHPTLATAAGLAPTAVNALASGGAVLAWIGSTNADDMTVSTAVLDSTGRHLSSPNAVAAPWPAGSIDDCGQLAMATDTHGETTLVWGCVPLPPGGGPSPDDVLAASVRPPGGRFAPGTVISPPDADATNAVLAADAEGNTILAYGIGDQALAEVRPASGEFGAPVAIGTGLPSFALAAADKVTVVGPGQLPGTATLTDWNP